MSDTSASTSAAHLIQNDQPNAEGNREMAAAKNPEEDASTSSVCGCDISTRKFGSLALMAIILLLGVVFLVAGKVDTDKKGIHISEFPVYRYLTVMLFLATLWMFITIFAKFIPQTFREKWLSKHEEPDTQLIPKHLLVGVMFFGLGSSFMTMVELLEYASGYDCPSGDLTMLFYFIMRTVFIYSQLYFFYKLSRSRKKILFCSHFLVMHLIAVNLGTWIVTFVHDSTEELHNSTSATLIQNNAINTSSLVFFMAHHWGITLDNEEKGETRECLKTANDLESTAKTMEPYFYTFTMEYCLISAGLLLNVWLSLRGGVPEEPTEQEGERGINGEQGGINRERGGINGDQGINDERGFDTDLSSTGAEWELVEAAEGVQEVGTLWRFGFILGLVYVPAFAAMIFNILFTDTEEEDKQIYVGFQLFFLTSILVASLLGSQQLEKQKEGKIHSKVDFYLLAGALVGVFFLDIFIVIASVCELKESTSMAVLLIIANITELACSIAFTHFVRKAMERELPEENNKLKVKAILNSASNIREVVSFLFMLNICFWGMYTFEVKRSDKVLPLAKNFYGRNVWFYISHFVYPLAVFFHFHGAVCMVEVLNKYSKVPFKGISSASESMSGSSRHAVRA